MKYLTHEMAEIRSAVYCSIAMLVAVSFSFRKKKLVESIRSVSFLRFQSRLSVEETVKTTIKAKKTTHQAAHFDETQFVCNVRVLTEIVTRGMNDLATKVRICSSFLRSFDVRIDFQGR